MCDDGISLERFLGAYHRRGGLVQQAFERHAAHTVQMLIC